MKQEDRKALLYGVLSNAIFFALLTLGTFVWHIVTRNPSSIISDAIAAAAVAVGIVGAHKLNAMGAFQRMGRMVRLALLV